MNRSPFTTNVHDAAKRVSTFAALMIAALVLLLVVMLWVNATPAHASGIAPATPPPSTVTPAYMPTTTTMLTQSGQTFAYNALITLQAQAVDFRGHPIVNQLVSFYDNGGYVGKVLTGADGIATITIKIRNVGTHTVYAEFYKCVKNAGEGYLGSFSEEISLTITR